MTRRTYQDSVSHCHRTGQPAPYRRRAAAVALLALAILILAPCQPGGAQVAFDRPPIGYSNTLPNGRIVELQEQLDADQQRLEFDRHRGYLPNLLRALGISSTSQVLVFSKTSFQQSRISPRRPRALYFNDNTYVGWVPNGDVIEVSTVDPQLGAVFYTLDQVDAAYPQFERQTHKCLTCHGSSHTGGIPGHFVRSVYPDRNGRPVLSAGSFRTDYTSPFRQRWGGWYVSGKHGSQRHMGNVTVSNTSDPENLDRDAGANITDLGTLSPLNTKPYLTGHSDLVALLVLEHQVAMHNALTAANYSARITLRDAQIMNEALERPEDFESESTRRRLDSAAERLVKTLLLGGALELQEPVSGTSGFAEHFTKLGPFDAQGRSLRDLDLKHRLFQYPCSYLIYSSAFDQLPAPLHQRVIKRFRAVLLGGDEDEAFAHLTAGDRRDIWEILSTTKDQFAKKDQ